MTANAKRHKAHPTKLGWNGCKEAYKNCGIPARGVATWAICTKSRGSENPEKSKKSFLHESGSQELVLNKLPEFDFVCLKVWNPKAEHSTAMHTSLSRQPPLPSLPFLGLHSLAYIHCIPCLILHCYLFSLYLPKNWSAVKWEGSGMDWEWEWGKANL